MEEKEWIKVYETTEAHKALLVQSILGEYGIDSVLLNKMDSTNIMMGEINVMVSEDRAAEAIILIDAEFL
jgi:hypothetical protein